MTTTMTLCTGSGALLDFGSPDANGVLDPLTLDSSSVAETGTSTWVEVRPNGFRLYYGEPPPSGEPTPPGADPLTPPPPPGGECPALPDDEGFVRNNLPPGYAVPFVGVAVRTAVGLAATGQPALCAIDEWTVGDVLEQKPQYLTDRRPNALDLATQVAQQFTQGWKIDSRQVGNHLGRPDATCQVNLTSGNLCVSIVLPSAGPADPPIRLTYNSRSRLGYDCGYGWMTTYHAHVRLVGGGWRYLYKVESPAGAVWEIHRTGIDGPIAHITDPYSRQTQFRYSGGYLSEIEDTAGRITTFTVDSNGDLIAIQTPDGNTISLAYDADHRLVSWTNPQGDTTGFAYQCGLLTSITSPTNDTTVVSYPSAVQRTLTNAAGATTTFTLAADDNIESAEFVTDAGTVINTFSWAPLQRLGTVVNGAGLTTTLAYTTLNDRSSRLAMVERPLSTYSYEWNPAAAGLVAFADADAARSTLTWDASLNRTQLEDAASNLWLAGYTALGQPTQMADPGSSLVTWVYDAVGRYGTELDAAGNATTLTYDNNSQLEVVENPMGEVTTFSHDAMNRHTRTEDVAGDVTTFTYTLNGLPLARTNALGQAHTLSRDSSGRVVQSIAPGGLTTTFTYDAASNLSTRQTPGGGTTTFSYSPSGQPKAITNPLGRTITLSYDQAGRPSTITRPNNGVMTYSYDANGRPTQTTKPGWQTSQWQYNGNGKPTRYTDPRGMAITMTYDALGDRRSVTQPDGGVSTYSYDASRRPTEFVKPSGGAITLSYDTGGRVSTVTDPLGFVATFTYDAAKRIIGAATTPGGTTNKLYQPAQRRMLRTDPSGMTVTFSYSATQQLSSTAYADGTRTTLTYNATGLRETAQNAGGTWTTTYSPDGLAASVAGPAGALATYSYDAAGNAIGMTVAGYGTVDYTYTDDGALRTMSLPGGGVVTFSYDLSGQLTEQTFPGGVVASFTYDAGGLITGVTHRSGATLLKELTYTRDPVGRPAVIADSDGTVTTRTYDAVGQLAFEQRDGGPPGTSYAATYTYDPGENLLNIDWNLQRTTMTYADNRLAVLETPSGVTTYTFDAAGRRTGADAPTGLATLTWDDAALLTAIDGPLAASLTYSPDGLPHTHTLGGTFRSLRYDASRLLAELDGSSVTQARYLASPGSLPANVLGQLGQYLCLYDAEGNTTTLVDQAGNLLASLRYGGMGQLMEAAIAGGPTLIAAGAAGLSDTQWSTLLAALNVPWLNTGQHGGYTIAAPPLTLMPWAEQRYFDPATCRFISPRRVERPEQCFDGTPLYIGTPADPRWELDGPSTPPGFELPALPAL